MKYSSKYGVSAASRFYRVSGNAIYEWRAKYDGKSWKSLKDKSHRPHNHQNEHTPEENEIILRRYPRHKDDLIMLWNTLKKSGYKRSYVSWVRVINKWVKPELKARTERKPMPYQRAGYPGQKVQADVKFVPSYCLSPNKALEKYLGAM